MTERIDEQTGEIVQVVETMPVLNEAEVNMQVKTAKAYPRNITQFKQDAMNLVCLDEETAGQCFYDIPRAGRSVSGPSVRLAEIAAHAWKNLRIEARKVGEDDHRVYYEAVVWDMEANVAFKVPVSRKITDKNGKRFSDDMVAVTCQAASSIALRNAIFKAVPRAYINDLERAARKTAIGDIKTLASRRGIMIDWYAKRGITVDRILARLERPGVADITLDDLVLLKGAANAIETTEITPDEAFPEIKPVPDTNGKKAGFDLGQKKAQKPSNAVSQTKPETIAEPAEPAPEPPVEPQAPSEPEQAFSPEETAAGDAIPTG